MPMGIPMMPVSPQVLLPGPKWREGPPYRLHGLHQYKMMARKRNFQVGPWNKPQRFPGINRMLGKIDFDDDDDFRHKMFSRNIMRRFSKENSFPNPLNIPKRRMRVPHFKRPFRRPYINRLSNVEKDDIFDFNERKHLVQGLRRETLYKRQMRPYQDQRFKDDFIEDYSDSFDDRPYDNDYGNVDTTSNRDSRRFRHVLYADDNNSRIRPLGQSFVRQMHSPTVQQFQNHGLIRNQEERIGFDTAASGLREGLGVQTNFARAQPQVIGNNQAEILVPKLDTWDQSSINLPPAMKPKADTERGQMAHVGDLSMSRVVDIGLSHKEVSNQGTGVALPNAKGSNFQHVAGNSWRGETPTPTFGQNLIDNLDLNNQQWPKQNPVTENTAFSLANNQVKQSTQNNLQVFQVNPFANDQSELVIGMDDPRDIDQATFALLGIEPSSVDASPVKQGIQHAATQQVHVDVKDQHVVQNSWSKSEMSAFLPVSQNNQLLSAHLIQEQGQSTNVDDPLVNKDIQTDKHLIPNVVNGDSKMPLNDPPAIHIQAPVSENTLVKEQTLSNMIKMPGDMLQTDKLPPVPLGQNDNRKMSTTNDHSVTTNGLTANTLKDSFVNLDHLDFGFDSFEEDLINHNVLN